MFRSATITLILMSCLSGAAGVEIDASAVAALNEGNAAIERADADPNQNLVAALAFSRALPAYEAAGDLETAAELRSVIFWCKKRMDLGALQRFVANKGQEGEALANAVAKIEQPVPATEAKAYLDNAEAYAKKNPGQSLKIAIRYFEVADRFQGTPESLKAQRLSLEALQQTVISRRAADPALAAELRSAPITAGDLPESAQKLIAPSNKTVEEVAAKAAQDVAQDRRKATEVVLKEAEAAQRKGDLDRMIVHQNQVKDMDREFPGLSKSATTALETYRKARTKTVTKAANDVIAERKKLIQALVQAQKEETKKGNTGGGLAIKNTIETIIKDVEQASAATLAGLKEPIRPFVIKPDGGVFLGRLPIKKSEGEAIIAKDEASATRVIMIEGKRCFEYLSAHAPSASTFDIPASSRQFTAYGMSTGYQSMKFIVNIDGKTVFTSGQPPSYPNSLVPVNIMIPEGAKRIELIVDPCGDNTADHSLWAYPYFAR